MRICHWLRAAGSLFVALVLPAVLAGCGPGQVVRVMVVECDGDDEAVALSHNGENLALLATNQAGDRSSWLVVTMTPEGRELWRRQYRQGEVNVAGDVAYDQAGNVFVTGSSVLEGREMCVAARYRADGAILWQRALAVGEASAGRGIALAEDRVYVGGWTRAEDRQELLLVALNREDGATLWSRNWRLGGLAAAERLAVDPRADVERLVVSGITGSAENPDILLAAFDAKGDTSWTRSYDGGGEDRPGGVAVDRYGHVIATGTARTPAGPRCVIIERHPDGELIRQTAYGGTTTAEGRGLALTPEGGVFVAGTLVAGGERWLLAFEHLPGVTSTWERNWREGGDVTGAAVAAAGDVFALGTVAKPGANRNIALVRFSRPQAE
ncbi:MAG: PQQ-binding-like beta-propeller repeat protein [bacterium]